MLLDRSHESSSEVSVDIRSLLLLLLLLLDNVFLLLVLLVDKGFLPMLLVDGRLLQLELDLLDRWFVDCVFLLLVLLDKRFELFLGLVLLLMLGLMWILICVLVLVGKTGMEEVKEFFFCLKRRFMLRRPSSGL